MFAMTKHLHPSRPAIAAIAAVLVLAIAPAGAQPAPDVSSDPVIVAPETPPVVEPAPAPEALTTPTEPTQPAQVQIAPRSEVVQSVPASEPEEAAPAPVATNARTKTVRPAAAPAAVTPAATPTPRSEVLTGPVAAPVTTPAAQPAADLAQTTPTVRPVSTANPDVTDAAWWALGGGALLFVGGLGALALGRNRKRPESVRAAHPRNRAPAEPVAVQPAVAAEAAIAVPEPIMVAAPAKASRRTARAAHSDWPELEEMVAEAPSPDNPFLTRSKRMRRAKFLLEHGEPQPISQPAVKQVARDVKQVEKPKVAAKVVNGKSSATYSFGSKAKPRTNWKPATT